jgi:hypothetical protein
MSTTLQQRNVVAHEAIIRFLREAAKWDLDIFGVDYNQADKQLEQAMLEIFNGVSSSCHLLTGTSALLA